MSTWRTRLHRALTGRDVLASYLVFLGLVTLALLVDRPILQVPGHVLLLGFDVVQTALVPGITGVALDTARAFYLYLLAVAVVGLYRTGLARFGSEGT